MLVISVGFVLRDNPCGGIDFCLNRKPSSNEMFDPRIDGPADEIVAVELSGMCPRPLKILIEERIGRESRPKPAAFAKTVAF